MRLWRAGVLTGQAPAAGGQGLPITLVLVAATGALVLAAAAAVFLAGYQVARLNTAELARERSEVAIRLVVERTRGHLEPVRAQLEYLAGLIARERPDLAKSGTARPAARGIARGRAAGVGRRLRLAEAASGAGLPEPRGDTCRSG